MQKAVEYTANRVSPATVELLIRERSKGKSLENEADFGQPNLGNKEELIVQKRACI